MFSGWLAVKGCPGRGSNMCKNAQGSHHRPYEGNGRGKGRSSRGRERLYYKGSWEFCPGAPKAMGSHKNILSGEVTLSDMLLRAITQPTGRRTIGDRMRVWAKPRVTGMEEKGQVRESYWRQTRPDNLRNLLDLE